MFVLFTPFYLRSRSATSHLKYFFLN